MIIYSTVYKYINWLVSTFVKNKLFSLSKNILFVLFLVYEINLFCIMSRISSPKYLALCVDS